MDLSFHVQHRDHWTVLAVSGEVDTATAPRLRDRLVGLLSEGDKFVVVELSGVTGIDGMGIGALIDARWRIKATDGELLLAAAPAAVTRVFEATDMTRVFVLHPTVDHALAAAAAAPRER